MPPHRSGARPGPFRERNSVRMKPAIGSPDSYRIVIPTRDSARWVGLFLDAYRHLGVEPLYIVDSRSKDATLDLLRDKGADLAVFTPWGDIVEAGMIAFGAGAAGTPWVLRLDDDEFPSRNLLSWIDRALLEPKSDAFEISRREISRVDGRHCYTRWPTRWASMEEPFLTPQIRLFDVRKVNYIQKVHTPGFERPAHLERAPWDCFFVHCNNLLRSPSERLQKVRTYARHDERTAWMLVDECLPELTESALHAWASDHLEEFAGLLASLPTPADQDIPVLTDRERELMSTLIYGERLQEALAAREAYEAATGLNSRWFPYIPSVLLKPFAELLCSLGFGSLRETGVRMWNYYRYLQKGPFMQK